MATRSTPQAELIWIKQCSKSSRILADERRGLLSRDRLTQWLATLLQLACTANLWEQGLPAMQAMRSFRNRGVFSRASFAPTVRG